MAARAIPKYWEQHRQGKSFHSPLLTATPFVSSKSPKNRLKDGSVSHGSLVAELSEKRGDGLTLQGKAGDVCYYKHCSRSVSLITAIVEESRGGSSGVC